MATLRDKHPSFWNEEEETFDGPVSTNAIEGGNWRLKYGLGCTIRARATRHRARTVLSAVRDSVSVFENGGPRESFAFRHGSFNFKQVMDSHSEKVTQEIPRGATTPVAA